MSRRLKNNSRNKVLNVLLLQDNSGRLRHLSKEECRALINSCDFHLKPIVITVLNANMRRGEILSPRWDQVDLKHGFILLGVTKNGGRRKIPINKTLEAVFLDKSLIRRLDISYVLYGSVTGKPY